MNPINRINMNEKRIKINTVSLFPVINANTKNTSRKEKSKRGLLNKKEKITKTPKKIK